MDFNRYGADLIGFVPDDSVEVNGFTMRHLLPKDAKPHVYDTDHDHEFQMTFDDDNALGEFLEWVNNTQKGERFVMDAITQVIFRYSQDNEMVCGGVRMCAKLYDRLPSNDGQTAMRISSNGSLYYVMRSTEMDDFDLHIEPFPLGSAYNRESEARCGEASRACGWRAKQELEAEPDPNKDHVMVIARRR
jgi:hypothetical protein